MATLKERTGMGLLWGGLNNLFLQVVGVVFGIILGRLLSQADYGMMAMISVFALVANALQNSGFTTALINLDQPTHRDYNAVFWFNIIVGAALYLLLFLCAPLIAHFYGNALLVPLCRYAFLSVVIASFGTAQNAWLFKHLRAKEQAKGAMIAVMTSSIIGVGMAVGGMGYWSLATQNLLYILVYTICAWHYSAWRPTVNSISFAPVRQMFRFSSKILLTTITTIVNNNVLNILLGRLFGARQTGIYNQAYQWNNKGYSVVQNMVNQVAQPVLVDLRSDGERQVRALRKLMRFTAFVSFPLLIGLATVAKEFIVVAITEKWLPSAALLQILCLAGACVPLSTLLSNLIISKGKSNLYLYCTVALFVLQLGMLLLIALYDPHGLRTMVIGYTSLNIAWLFVWHFFAWQLTGYSLWQFLQDIIPFAVITGVIAVLTILLTLSLKTLWLLLIVKIIIFAVLYYAAMKVLRVQILAESEDFIKQQLRK